MKTIIKQKILQFCKLFTNKSNKNKKAEVKTEEEIIFVESVTLTQIWFIRNITKKLRCPRQPSINSAECTDTCGARWSLSFFPYDRRIDNEEYISFRVNLFTYPKNVHLPCNVFIELSLLYFTGVYVRRRTFYQEIHLEKSDDIIQVIFRHTTNSLKRQLRRNKHDNLLLDTLQVGVVIHFGKIQANDDYELEEVDEEKEENFKLIKQI